MPVQNFIPPRRLLLGPGPSMVHPRVLRALSTPLLGHLDPAFLAIMDDIQVLLRFVFQTKNRFTIAVSGTGSAGMEASIVNIVEPGDAVIVGVNGVFGTRWATIVERCGGKAIRVEAPWGQIIESEAIEQALRRSGPVKAMAIVHAETSTGAWQPLEPISRLCRDHDTLFLVDAVTSLGGAPVEIDRWDIDVCYSGTQKCLSCPPGLAPVSLSPRALESATKRKSKVQSWYLDVNLLAAYWGQDRVYHHTAPISMNYSLHEALRLVANEGLENRWRRHEQNHLALKAGLKAIGIPIASQEGHQLWQLNALAVPDGIDEAAVRKRLLSDFNIEIGAGLGPLKGKIWRVGLMGETSSKANVKAFLSALGHLLNDSGRKTNADAALEAAG
jgi:alanine-glyoxylate transaminase/serine-glyoxylate transaminase/serine-pyruvate transaminase